MLPTSCHTLRDAGTATWLDQLSRDLILDGRLASLLDRAALSGVTSNPSIFHQAMTTGQSYDAPIAALAARGLGAEEIYESLAVEDIRLACDVLRPVYDATRGGDGFVSLEVSPHLARDTAATTSAARRLYARVDRPNLMIKVPGTPEGLPAVETLLAEGIAVNVTLLFGVEAYESVIRAYLRGLEGRVAAGQAPDTPSVASFFVSRIDTLVDSLLEEAAGKASGEAARAEILALRGRTAVANARLAYRSYQAIFGSAEFAPLRARGARVQRPLWASTSTKNPAYLDVMYVEPLIGPDTVNTMPPDTLEAFIDHGRVVPGTVTQGLEEAEALFRRLAGLGISMPVVAQRLLDEGITKFVQPYDKLLAALEAKRKG
jgi:transaldolase